MSAKHTPGPWNACQKGKCPCKQVWCDDHPVAYVVTGKWGDEYASIRLVGGSLEVKAEPYMDMIEYGEVSEKVAAANAQLIAAAPVMLEALEFVLSQTDGLEGVDWRLKAHAAIRKATEGA